MELCTGGSLFNLLDDPENSYGLIEDEFILGKIQQKLLVGLLNPKKTLPFLNKVTFLRHFLKTVTFSN